MKKRFTSALLWVAIFLNAYDAASQCSSETCSIPIPAFDAFSACILPNEHALSCYHGETQWTDPVSIPPFWCTTVENNQWFAFFASAENVSFELGVGNCEFGGALQAALLTTWDCVNFDFVSDCLGNIPAGSTITLANNVPLTPGEVYYLMIDGSAGAKCQFSINDATTIVSGPTSLCLPDAPAIYANGTESFWSINPPSAGTILNQMPANFAEVQWLQPGNAQLCASSVSCSATPPFCMDISIGQSVSDSSSQYLCFGGTVFCGNQLIDAPGFHVVYEPAPNGCDSIFYCEVIQLQPILTNLGQFTLPCEGFFASCGDTITGLGYFETICQNWQGCDSIVSFTLLEGDVYANAGQDVLLPCGTGQVSLNAAASSQGANFAYQWTTTDGHIVGGETTTTPIVDAAGNYCITVTNLTTGCKMTDCTRVFNQLSLAVNGPDLFCPGQGNSLAYQVQASTNAPATLFFQAGSSPVQTANIAAGTTTRTFVANLDTTAIISVWGLINANCVTDTIELLVNENNARIEFELTQTACNTGQLEASLVGNFQNVAFSYNWGAGSPNMQTINVSQNGTKTVTIRDNYGCFWTASYNVEFDHTGLCAYLQGTVRNDLSTNCALSPDDLPLEGWIVEANGTAGTFFGTTDSDGHYWIPVSPGTYTLSVLLPNDNGFAACGNDFAATVGSIGDNFTQDFLLYQIPDCPYMTIDIANNMLRRCFNNTFAVRYCNEGSAVATDASIVVALDPFLSFVSAGLPSTDLGNNLYQFNLGNLQPGQCGDFLINAYLTCNVPLGQVHCASATVYPQILCTGYGPNDFTDETCRPNIGSYDPNVKIADPPGIGSEHFIVAGTELTYNIRFQNTGTDTAFNVVVRDTLADKFDLSTLQPGAGSHHYTMDFYGPRVLKFEFDNIKLPPMGTNELGSIGFFQFKVKLKDDLPALDRIENQASVYFDYNEPVATNTYFHTIRPDAVVTNIQATICEGEEYPFNGAQLNQTGDYTAQLVASNGADSTVNLSLTVFPEAETNIEEAICEGQSIVFNGEVLTETGDIKLVLQTVHGCDSLVNFSLDVWPVYDLYPTVQICNGASYAFNGQIISQAGTYIAEMVSTHGCDSTITVQLELVDSFDIHLNESICEGDSYLFDGQSLTQPGAYFAEYETAAGCDSTVALNLAVWPNFLHTVNISICEGNAFDWEGQAITDAGIYSDTLPTVHGCDSIIILIVEVLPNSETTINATICQGGTYLLEGQPYDVAGTYTALLINSYGCDSLLTLNLSVNPAPVVYDTLSVVQGTIHNGITLLSDTTITEVQMDDFGCETIISTHFIVLPNATQDALEGSSFEVFPNPASGQFFVRFDLMRHSNVRLEVLDVLGRVLYANSAATEFAAGKHQLAIQSNDWPSGVYFVRLGVGEAGFAKKIVVERL
jgi:uncharacterized repeat protein (TIGR01451 family)